MANDCPRFGKLVRGCNFIARYDYGAARPIDEIMGGASGEVTFTGNVNGILEKSRTKTYVHDVCTSCGKTVKRT